MDIRPIIIYFFSIFHDTHWVPARYPGKHKKEMGCHFLKSRMIPRQCLLECKDTMKTKWSLKLERIEGLIIRLSCSTLNKLSFCMHSWMLIHLQRCPLQKKVVSRGWLTLFWNKCLVAILWTRLSKMWHPNRKDLIGFQLWVHLESALHLRCLKTLRASQKIEEPIGMGIPLYKMPTWYLTGTHQIPPSIRHKTKKKIECSLYTW